MTYPKLRYPIHTKGLSNEDRMILLAYDMLWRLKGKITGFANVTTQDDDHDIDANLSNLGHHIETMLCGGDMTLRFEGYDNMGSADMQKHFEDRLQRELFTEDAINEDLEGRN